MAVLNFISTQIFGNAGVLFGLIVLAGLVIRKKSVSDIISGTVKAIAGYYVLCAGCNVLQEAINPVVVWIQQVIGVEGVQPVSYTHLCCFVSTAARIRITRTSAVFPFLAGTFTGFFSVAMEKARRRTPAEGAAWGMESSSPMR